MTNPSRMDKRQSICDVSLDGFLREGDSFEDRPYDDDSLKHYPIRVRIEDGSARILRIIKE